MKRKISLIAAGALLTIGSTSVFARDNTETITTNEPNVQIEEGFIQRGPNAFRMRDQIDEESYEYDAEFYEEHVREMERIHRDWDNLTEEEREEWNGRRNQWEDRDGHSSPYGYGMMGPRNGRFQRHRCGFRR